ncbi:DUF4395 domain-containing protein [Sulfurovum sp. zt1-1]|uniref:DUF4395 domain-containing protein n=1 Tax=Sulfurovum zhangzhouensis TaxID=3019067 RepID=A0ABT7QZ78_9BACT|nr:DUF4395 domain-containing protein [Sulfurovum zhangzhouensis]MDM5271824.1 DUF4395 domain-containing protein [Sulfurovum zhangzhouensis]
MSPSCPISTRRVDANMVRIISFQVALITLALIITGKSFLAFLLLFDFAVRISRRPELSLFNLIAKYTVNRCNITPKLCDESPKRFALGLGFFTSLLLVVLYLAGLYTIASVVGIVLLFAALLETIFDFCIGCKLYYAIQLIKSIFNK